jgi:hypothetical protein
MAAEWRADRIAAAREQMEAPAFAAAWEAGRALPLDAAMAEALAFTSEPVPPAPSGPRTRPPRPSV